MSTKFPVGYCCMLLVLRWSRNASTKQTLQHQHYQFVSNNYLKFWTKQMHFRKFPCEHTHTHTHTCYLDSLPMEYLDGTGRWLPILIDLIIGLMQEDGTIYTGLCSSTNWTLPISLHCFFQIIQKKSIKSGKQTRNDVFPILSLIALILLNLAFCFLFHGSITDRVKYRKVSKQVSRSK